MTLGEWLQMKQKTTGDLAAALKVEKDTVRAWLRGRLPVQKYREKIFVLTNGQVSYEEIFYDHPDTVIHRTGGRSVNGR